MKHTPISHSDDRFGIVPKFEQELASDPDAPIAVAAYKALMEVIRKSSANTMMELRDDVKAASNLLSKRIADSISVSSASELFIRFVSRAPVNATDFETCKQDLLERGRLIVERALDSRSKIAKLGSPFLHDGARVLTHSRSRVVLKLLLEAASQNKRLHVFVTESRPDNSGEEMVRALQEANIPVSLILDSAVGYIIDQVDLVLVGAEGVVENGGIINKIGTYGISVISKDANKPVYVVTESFKFVRAYPISQTDLDFNKDLSAPFSTSHEIKQYLNPKVDYTPPNYIALLFTDLGVFTPSAVSDELIKLYY
eukprot:Colp12_sorted_trinity150504_noHs@16498